MPFLKRAQIAAADLARAGVAAFRDLDRLTMFADNLVPHVLRVDGMLTYDAELLDRIERGELIEHGSPEEVEIRACALHAVELIVAEQRAGALRGRDRPAAVAPRPGARATRPCRATAPAARPTDSGPRRLRLVAASAEIRGTHSDD